MKLEKRVEILEMLADPDVEKNLLFEFFALWKLRREVFEAEGIGEYYDRFQKALEKEPHRNIDLIGEIFTPPEEKKITKLFHNALKRGEKIGKH